MEFCDVGHLCVLGDGRNSRNEIRTCFDVGMTISLDYYASFEVHAVEVS